MPRFKRSKRKDGYVEEIDTVKFLEPTGPDPQRPETGLYPLAHSDWIQSVEEIVTDEPTREHQFNQIIHSINEGVKPARIGNKWNNFQHFTSVSRSPSLSSTHYVYPQRGFSIYRGKSRAFQFAYPQYRYQTDTWVPEPYGPFGKFDDGLPVWDASTDERELVPRPANLDDLVALSLRTMLPNIKAELSSINSLLELKDVKRLATRARDVYLFLRKLRESAHARKVAKKATLRDLIKATPDLYLEYSFGVLPLISDMVALKRIMSDLAGRINDLVSRAGRVQVRHFRRTFVEYPNITEQGGEADVYNLKRFDFDEAEEYGAYWQHFRAGRDVVYSDSVFHAEIEYNYNYTQYQTEHARLYSLLDRFGVNFNPSILWNAVPWTFVLDWVLGVSQYLDQFKVTLMEPQINIHRFLWSIKRERRIQVWREYDYSSALGEPLPRRPRYHFPAVVQTAYRRQVELPSSSSISSSGVSLREFTLGAALVYTRGKHRHHRTR